MRIQESAATSTVPRQHFSLRRTSRLLISSLATIVLATAMMSPTAAARGTKPTHHNTGGVECRLDLNQRTASITAKRPTMQTFGNYFNGYFAANSRLQWSVDGTNWQTLAGTKQSHGRTRIPGQGASAFHNVTWGAWAVTAESKAYVFRVRTEFRWLNASRQLVAKRVRVADYYRTETYFPGNYFPSVTTGDVGCVLPS